MSVRIDAQPPGMCEPMLAVRGLSLLMTATQPFDDVLHDVVELASVAVPAAGCAITYLLDNGDARTESSEPVVAELARLSVELGSGPTADALHLGRITRTGAVSTELRWPVFARRAAGESVRSMLALPVSVGGRLVAVLTYVSHLPHAFGDLHQEAAESFAAVAAPVLRNAQVAGDLRSQNQNLTQALTSRAVIDQAIGIVMSRTGTTAEEAFRRLRNISQREHVKVGEVARRTVEDAVRRSRARIVGESERPAPRTGAVR